MILDQEYRLLAAVSNSTMKDFRTKGAKFFFDNYVDPMRPEPREWSTESTDIGDLVDCLLTPGLTSSGIQKLFEKYYYITGDVKISLDFKKVLDTAWQAVLKHLLEHTKLKYEEALQNEMLINCEAAMDYIIKAARDIVIIDKDGKEKTGYRSNYGDEAMAKLVRTDGAAYYKDLGTANGRKIIDQTTYNIAVRAKDSVLNHDVIGKLFEIPANKKEAELKGQLMLQANIVNVPCKSLLDYTKFDHINKIIYPKDVKSALSHAQFMINYVRFDYPYQGSFYTGMLKAVYPDYKVAPFEFIVCCTDSGEDPMTYRMTERELTIARDGAVLKSGRKVPGWMNTLNEIRWHYEHDMWRYPREYYDKGFISLNTFNSESIEGLGDSAEDVDDIF